ncbi:hypothetical protein [Alistipes sp. ZOR0009]|uniref:hypothetical protein n=1 Tax=Alistipes sp. ZOR0009 TaxID=1339253 RepID=UPI0006490223|nr:hypothetical protein [Alistipes sp. ZOR0009]
MSLKNNITTFAATFLLFIAGASAQDFKVHLDSSKILIGSQTALKVEVLLKEGKKVRFPNLPDTLQPGLEVVAQFATDTSKAENGAILLTKRYILTSFDSGSYVIPRIPILYFNGSNVDTLLTQPISLKVNTVAVDSTKRPLYGIKANIKAPYTFEEIAIAIIAILLLIGAIVGIVMYFRKNKEQPIFTFKKKIVEPAHVKAFKELEQLQRKKLWQNGHVKEYFSELTDILRKYLEERMNINAMEMTSFEIMASLKGAGYSNKVLFERLMSTMNTSDLVKFAKYTSDPIENDQATKSIYDFIDDTKAVVTVDMQNSSEEISSSDNK